MSVLPKNWLFNIKAKEHYWVKWKTWCSLYQTTWRCWMHFHIKLECVKIGEMVDSALNKMEFHSKERKYFPFIPTNFDCIYLFTFFSLQLTKYHSLLNDIKCRSCCQMFQPKMCHSFDLCLFLPKTQYKTPTKSMPSRCLFGLHSTFSFEFALSGLFGLKTSRILNTNFSFLQSTKQQFCK